MNPLRQIENNVKETASPGCTSQKSHCVPHSDLRHAFCFKTLMKVFLYYQFLTLD